MISNSRDELSSLFSCGLERVNPERMIKRYIKRQGDDLTIKTEKDGLTINLNQFREIRLIAVGKAAGMMTNGLYSLLGERISRVLMVTKHGFGHGIFSQEGHTHVFEAGHPIPDTVSVSAGTAITNECYSADADTLLITAISGGSSSLVAAPIEGLSLSDKQETTRLLLNAGATIGELNCVRKHLSVLKGGKMAALLYPASSLNLILSDVVGDRLDVIASGLTAPDPTSYTDAAEILHRYSLWEVIPSVVRQVLKKGVAGLIEDTPVTDHPAFKKTHNILVGSGLAAVEAVEKAARKTGYNTFVLSTQLTGEAQEIAKVFYALARDIYNGRVALCTPACVIAGGETTVTINGNGKGGRCQEMALSFLAELADDPDPPRNTTFLAAGTDGNDGPTDAAGAFADSKALCASNNANLRAILAKNDSYSFHSEIGTLLKIGSTDTNVADIYLMTVNH